MMMKADVLNDFDIIKVATHYKIDGQITEEVPFDQVGAHCEPMYHELKGWNGELSNAADYDALPEQLHAYVKFVEQHTGVPVKMVSVGPDRTQTFIR